MIRQNQVRRVADKQIATDHDTQISQPDNFIDQGYRIDHYPVADNTDFVPAQNARWNQVQNVGLAAMNDGVAGVVTSLTAHNDVGVCRQEIDDFSFPLITPLRAD